MGETLSKIPQIEVGDTETTMRAFRDIGFVFVKAPSEVTDALPEMYTAFEKLFDLTEEQKLVYERKRIHRQRGYTPLNAETGIFCRNVISNPDGTSSDMPNYGENWFIGPEITPDSNLNGKYSAFYQQNVWPDEVPELQEAIAPVYDGLQTMGRAVLQSLTEPLGQEPDYFETMVENAPGTLFRPLHYPAISPEQADSVIGACDHTDINLVTVLPAPAREGLWVKTRAGEWIKGQAPAGHVIVQVADMLQHVTGGYFLSAQHKVHSPIATSEGDKGRYSSALFVHPAPDVLLEPIPEFTKNPDSYKPITAGDFLMKRLAEIGLASKQA
jgi:isopenicillin N synthase-like dioxygenase